LLAYVAIRRRDTAAHRRWMIRCYALTFAAVTLRIQLGLLLLGGLSMEAALALIAWSCWIPNWLAVEAWLRRSSLRGIALVRSPADPGRGRRRSEAGGAAPGR
jgi:hypothetical protein